MDKRDFMIVVLEKDRAIAKLFEKLVVKFSSVKKIKVDEDSISSRNFYYFHIDPKERRVVQNFLDVVEQGSFSVYQRVDKLNVEEDEYFDVMCKKVDREIIIS